MKYPELVVVVSVIPPTTDPENEAAIGHVIEAPRHVGQEIRVAVIDRRHQAADLDAFRHVGHCPERGPVIQVGAVGITRQGEEMVPIEERVGATGIDRLPSTADLRGGRVLLGDLSPLGWLPRHAPFQCGSPCVRSIVSSISDIVRNAPRNVETQGRRGLAKLVHSSSV